MPLASLRVESNRNTVKLYRNLEGILAPGTGGALKAAVGDDVPAESAVPPTSAPVLIQHAVPGKRPYIHPILAPDGVGELTENEPGHHRWQHGLYVGLNDVNGVGFWTEGLSDKTRASDGSFHPRPMQQPTVRQWPDHTRAAWEIVCDWHASPSYTGPGGAHAPLLIEAQTWCLQDHASYFLLDLTWTLEAMQDLTFGKYAYGGVFLRMPFRDEYAKESSAINSAGQKNEAAEAQRAKWVAVNMPLSARAKKKPRECGIAMLDHPSNPGHPAPWRVDGQLGIAPSRSIPDAWSLKKGMTTTSRYRLFIFTGPTDPAQVDQQWLTYAREEK